MYEVCIAVVIFITIILGAAKWIADHAPEGYEDAQGWHQGKPQ